LSNTLSYTKLRTYDECGYKYYLQYKERIREIVKGSALFFGTAIDKATEACVKDKSINEFEVFDNVWSYQSINGVRTYLPECDLVRYSASDFDSDLLTTDDTRFLTAKAEEYKLTWDGCTPVEVYNYCLDEKKDSDNPLVLKYYNLCSWVSLRRKGHLMLKAHREHILPRHIKVLYTQKKIALDNGAGDTLVGYPDLICEWDDGRTIIFDYKTSSVPYKVDAVKESMQLTLYSHAESIPTCGYIVFLKKIKKNRTKICSSCGFNGSVTRHKTCVNEVEGKRCNGSYTETLYPECEIQIIIDDIPPDNETKVLDNIETTNQKIHNEVFEKNLNSCYSPFPCPFIGLCHKGSMKGLEKG
jgi:hypothetical protein